MNNEFRVYGPPGTGKTTRIKEMVQKAIAKVGAENIMVASFSKGAAMELKGRDLKLDAKQIGTLHSFCYKMLGNPRLAEESIELWNAKYPILEISHQKPDLDDATQQNIYSDGEKLLSQLNILRGSLTIPSTYPYDVFDFREKWNAFKEEYKLLDYCDLIENTLKQNIYPQYSVGFFDEAQDFTPLELALVRNWGKNMKFYVLAGDDDQCIYSFKGCTPDGFIGGDIPNMNITVLSQSYRMPIMVQKYANDYIKNVSNRVKKKYSPREFSGQVIHSYLRYIDNTAILNDANQYIKQGKTVMFLTSCSYMLNEIICELKLNALPFHNPYRRKRGDWNPLTVSNGISGTERILAFIKHDWTKADVYKWADILKSKDTMLFSAKKLIQKFKDDDTPFDLSDLNRYFKEDSVTKILERNANWYFRNILAERVNGLKYPIEIYNKYGKGKLEEAPKIIVGTIHSVKGGEADVVYLFPDISKNGARELAYSPSKQDDWTRVFYVGMTRTKETLILCQPATQYHVAI
jgi:DNA helicase-2/ATP-dependent DNA helicase PcrA